MDDGTAAEKKALRDSRPWGRLYVDGWPAPIQYLRSHFGGPAVEGMRPLVLADPLDACGPLRNADSVGASRETICKSAIAGFVAFLPSSARGAAMMDVHGHF